jgi:hypothetical protein
VRRGERVTQRFRDLEAPGRYRGTVALETVAPGSGRRSRAPVGRFSVTIAP